MEKKLLKLAAMSIEAQKLAKKLNALACKADEIYSSLTTTADAGSTFAPPLTERSPLQQANYDAYGKLSDVSAPAEIDLDVDTWGELAAVAKSQAKVFSAKNIKKLKAEHAVVLKAAKAKATAAADAASDASFGV